MTDTRLIAVIGATGTQGGGVAHAILDHAEDGFTIRALTRNPDRIARIIGRGLTAGQRP